MDKNDGFGSTSKSLPINKGLSRELQGKTVPMADEKSAYAPLIGGVVNGRGLTTEKFTKPGAGRSKDL